MDTYYTPPRTVPEDTRRLLARELSRYYSELSASDEKPAPRFSLARVLECMASPDGLRTGYEAEICGATATMAGTTHDQHRVMIPLHALQTRDMTVASASGGGYLVGTEMGSPIDVLRPWSVVASAGVTVLPGLVGNLTLPRVGTASTAGWVAGEGGTFTESQPVMGQAAMTPKTAAVMVEFSRQWRLQAAAGEELLRQQLLRAVGELVDKAFFAGSGSSGEPTGLLLAGGINTFSGSSLALAGLLEARDEILTAGGQEDRLRWVGTPAVQKLLAARERVANGGRHLWDDTGILGKPAHATKNAPAGMLAAGDFSAAVMGIWGPPALRLEINPYQSFAQGILAARVVLSCDFAFPQPGAFSVASSVT
jgi:HK97 family phage major capsid protein